MGFSVWVLREDVDRETQVHLLRSLLSTPVLTHSEPTFGVCVHHERIVQLPYVLRNDEKKKKSLTEIVAAVAARDYGS